MNLDRELAGIFLEEARGHLRVLEDPAQPARARVEAAHGLKGAAGLVGLDELRGAAAEAERLLRLGDASAAEVIARAAALLAAFGAELGDAPEPAEKAGAGALGLDSGFDADEAAMLKRFFLDEAQEHLEGIATTLTSLEREPTRRASIDDLLRKTHTLKGSAATVGLGAVAEAAHKLEDVFVQLRSGKLAPVAATLDALMTAVDTLRAIVESCDREAEQRGLAERLRFELLAVTQAGAETVAPHALLEADPGAVPVAIGEPADSGPIPAPRAAESNPRIELSAIVEHAPAADEGDVVFDDRRLAPDRRKDEHHLLRVDAARVDELMDGVGELVFDRTRIERRIQELRGIVRDLGRTRAGMRATLGPLRAVTGGADAVAPLAARIAELEAELAEHVANLSRNAATLLDDTEALRRTSGLLQSGLTQIRMMSVRWLFQRLARPLRDIARRAGKRIELGTAGEETELDKTVVEQITDPLIQILRNAVAHGIEHAHVRVQRGKPPAGRISLSARHQGDSVFLEVADDGGGIDVAKIRASMVASGRMSAAEAAAASDERVVAAIFEPGFSTRDAADELAGRGVGLDVVRESIARLGGEISVESNSGQGTHFTIRLPLTTAITQALLFKVAGHVYALPNVHVIETAYIEASTPAMPSHLRLRDEMVPLVSLHRLLGAEMPADARRVPAVVIEFAGRRLASTCDKVIGPREIVVKSLGPLLAPLGLYAGATISGAGKVQLILDPATLAQVAYPQKGVPLVTAATPFSESGAFPAIRSGAPAAAGSSGAALPSFTSPGRILVADDSRSVREALSRMLSSVGYVVDLAGDGWEAWEMLQDVRYDLLVTDLEMPRVGGAELIEKVRRAASMSELPVLVISSRTHDVHRQRADQAGANSFLAKPVTKRAIVERVAELLRR